MPAEQQVVENVPTPADNNVEQLGQEQINSDDVQCALLATACVKVQNRAGQSVEARALLDSGSQINLVTEQCVQKMGLIKRRCVFTVRGIGSNIALHPTGIVNVTIRSTVDSSFNVECEMFAVGKITSCLPASYLSQVQANEMSELKLADPKFCKPAKIEMLLGAQVWAEIIRDGIKRFSSGLTAQDSHLGWIVFGQLQPRHEAAGKAMCMVEESSDVELNRLLRKFWELQEPSWKFTLSADDEWVEQNFKSTYYRTAAGRYVVTIPINPRAQELGSTRAVAMKRFLQTEKRLCAVPELRQKYVDFMREYEELGHMKRVRGPSKSERAYHIPHHCVTKKFRVVFDASCKSESGVSFNDVQFSGAKLQDDLSAIITRFRCFKIAVAADVEKMFRQVKVNPEQWDLQRIFWRESPDEPIREYCLTVVTYGMASSGFNAVRAMHQCAMDHQESYPLAYKAITSNFYMDDMLTGADTEEQATRKCKQIISSLRAGGFKLSKFKSSSQSVLSKLTSTWTSERELTFPEDNNASMLGLVWNCARDEISYKVKESCDSVANTKRAVVSAIARLYDPNGYLAPVIISAKILIQDLWRSGVAWDEQIPLSILPVWQKYNERLSHLEAIRIPRWLGSTEQHKLELHGFADASTRAYAAVVYMRATSLVGSTSCRIIASKTRVAPIKTISVPRLELCAAELLCKLMEQVSSACAIKDLTKNYWSDSTIVLCWIGKMPCELKTFVANRVSTIQELSGGHRWRHVRSGDNPADLGSRGIAAEQLVHSKLWWQGPPWLIQTNEHWPSVEAASSRQPPEASEEFKAPIVASATIKKPAVLSINNISLLERRSTLQSVLRMTAFILRFVRNAKEGNKHDEVLPVTSVPLTSLKERDEALAYWARTEQHCAYHKEIEQLLQKSSLESSSSIVSLNPFLDSEGTLRVGGRLQNSAMPYEIVHPIIVPTKCKLSELLIREAHLRTLHGGVQLCMQYIRHKFWIPSLRRAVKTHISRCITCFRQSKATSEQLMGSLPKDRVQPTRAFKHSGVDYAGPVQIKARSGRSKIIEKGYIAVFVCMVTRAIHLEPVSNLTSGAFLAAFQRFTGRRGACSVLWSDNATTFVGADSELKRSGEQWKDRLPIQQINSLGTEWKFIVPGAPHMGGIWEAGVKSAKYHLRRIMGKQIFTFETLATTLVLIEACLNSRPLYALSDDVDDLHALTPGHFLIGEQMVLPLSADVSEVPQGRLKLWGIVNQMQQHFWKRWSREYIHTLQQRFKWNKKSRNVKPGDLVLVRQENVPPTIWPLGRVTAVHQGKDGLVRSAEVQLEHTSLVRAIHKLCVLPLEEPDGIIEDEPSIGGEEC